MQRILSLSLDRSIARPDGGGSDALDRQMTYVQALRKRDAQAEMVLFTPGRGSPFSPTPGLEVVPLGPRALYPIRSLLEGLRRGPFRIITSQSPFDDGAAACVLSRLTGARFLCQLHSEFTPASTLLLRSADAVRVVSNAQAAAVRRRGCRQVRCLPVPLAVNGHPGRTGSDILFVGRLAPEKHLPLLLDAYEALLRLRADARLVIAGDGPERRRIEARARELGVEMTGWIAPSRLPDLYRRAAVLVLPSKAEAFGRVILEAALFEVPCVATPTQGASELIEDGRTGFFARTADDIAERIERLLADESLRDRMGRAARTAALSRVDPARQAEQMADLLLAVAEGP